jgi:hypothetical protein
MKIRAKGSSKVIIRQIRTLRFALHSTLHVARESQDPTYLFYPWLVIIKVITLGLELKTLRMKDARLNQTCATKD